jgi:hypothetical protein
VLHQEAKIEQFIKMMKAHSLQKNAHRVKRIGETIIAK